MSKQKSDENDNPDHDEDDDSSLFRQFTKGTKPLKSDIRAPENKTRSARPRKSSLRQMPKPAAFTIDPDIDRNHSLFFHRGGLQHHLLKRFKRGDIPIESRLDLHGQTLDQAHHSVHQFIQRCSEAHLRCVLIVHGRGLGSEDGRPKLKQAVAQWLPSFDTVLAYCSATPAHGGVGAMYVMLRRRR